MGRYGGRRVFRVHPLALGIVALSTAVCGAGAMYMHLHGQSPWTTWGLAGMAVLGALGFVDWLVTRVELRDDAIHVRTLWLRRSYPRAEIEGASEEKGVSAALKLSGGRWARMPENIGVGFANSVRAWLKATH